MSKATPPGSGSFKDLRPGAGGAPGDEPRSDEAADQAEPVPEPQLAPTEATSAPVEAELDPVGDPDNQVDDPDNQVDDPDNPVDDPDNQVDDPDNPVDDDESIDADGDGGESSGPTAGTDSADPTDPGETADKTDPAAERDEYLDRLQRLTAEFENYRKRMTREQRELIERAAERLVLELLPVLDASLSAILQGADDVAPIHTQLADILAKQGLEDLAAEGDLFDPDRHEAVMHEPGDGDQEDGESRVAEVLRAGYGWKGRVLRPAMVKVRG